MAKQVVLSASNMKNALWETLQDVRDGRISAQKGASIAVQVKGICNVIRLQLDVARMQKTKITPKQLMLN